MYSNKQERADNETRGRDYQQPCGLSEAIIKAGEEAWKNFPRLGVTADAEKEAMTANTLWEISIHSQDY